MKLLRIIVFTLFSFFLQSAVAGSVIKLNTTGQQPLNTSDQMGFMDEVSKEAFRRIGYELQTLRLPAERGLKNSNQGLVSGEMSRIKGLDKKYTNLIRVPEKIMDWEFVVFSYKPISLTGGWSDLSGKAVSHINGWKILEKNIPSTAEITKTGDANGLFNLLRKKRTDYAIYERWGGRYVLKKMSMDEVGVCKTPLAIKEMFIYMHKKHKDIVPKLAAALLEMKKDGSYQKLVIKHLK